MSSTTDLNSNQAAKNRLYKTKIGHAHLKVRDIDRAVAFYTTFFDLDVIERVGDHYVFLSGGEFHHEIALQNVGSMAPAAPSHGVGLYHVAFEVPDKRSFALAYQALAEAGVSVGIVDHLISWAMYFNDPDGNGLEIYWDTRREPGGQHLWHGRNLPLSADQVLHALS
ncbi:MAG: VOC family protein [Anaerolineae bacterium]|nr:VOC family protein [Anaerolineae bacterium]